LAILKVEINMTTVNIIPLESSEVGQSMNVLVMTLDHLSRHFSDDEDRSHGMARGHNWEDRRVCYSKSRDSFDSQVRVHYTCLSMSRGQRRSTASVPNTGRRSQQPTKMCKTTQPTSRLSPEYELRAQHRSWRSDHPLVSAGAFASRLRRGIFAST
jgi:hypothetical protein